MGKIKSYKGFDKNLKCRGFQFEVGKEYVTDVAVVCESGFHACENPMDVFTYYPPAESRYCEVEQDGDISKHDDDTKVASTRIKINLEVGLSGLIKAGVEYILSKVDFDNARESNTGDQSAATNTGDYSAATNTGYQSAATNTGNHSAATNTGNQSAATNTGDHSAATNTGYRSAATNTGYRSAATNTGNQSAATNTGDHSAAEVSGKDSVALVTGKYSKAKGSVGCWIVLTERNDNYEIVAVKSFKVDGKKIKSGVFYTLKNNKVVEA